MRRPLAAALQQDEADGGVVPGDRTVPDVTGVVTPTVLILRAGADNASLLSASGIYLFGFTFLYVGVVNLTGLPQTASAGTPASSPPLRSSTRW